MIFASIITALWLGLITAISPCPLATNIAAISFLGRKTGDKRHVLGSGLLYSMGRTLAYVGIGSIITGGLLSSTDVSLFLQKYMNEALGPILILLGLVLLGWLGTSFSLRLGTSMMQKKANEGGMIWALPMGALFAISFCPVSAGLFFGGLLPLALKEQSTFTLPIVYGIGTAFPVVVFAFIIAFSSAFVGKVFNKLTKIEIWMRYFAGTAFILAGVYYCLTHIYGLTF
ncbi:sulfite exporter TauE/SafE family protein [Planctomycetota bacterium]|nr:sulfite exporter TauE/SafE family protein [Planctomycetota bacterium]